MPIRKLRTASFIILVGAGAAAVLGFVAYQRGADTALAAPKVWDTRMLAFGKGRASLCTVWRDGRILYQLRVEPYPPEAMAALKESPSSVQRQFKMEFIDADGFRLLSHSVEAKELVPVLSPDGTVVAIEARGDRQLSRDVYRRAEKWEIRWSYD